MNRCMALINKEALLKNVAAIRRLTPNPKTIIMVKANGYGHGLIEIASILKDDPQIFLGVAAVKEAQLLRRNEIRNPIFLFDGGAFVGNAKEIFDLAITPVLSSRRALDDLASESKNHLSPLAVHLKIDTGFMRNGFDYEDLLKGVFDQDLEQLKMNPHLKLEGITTHFCLADYPDSDFTAQQVERFEQCLNYISARGLDFSYIHFANSAAILRCILPNSKFNNYQVLSRPGLLAYGISPLENPSFVTPVMSIKAQIVAIKNLKAGAGIGYGHTFHAPSPRKIGIVAMGYGDGLKRILSNRIYVLVKGQKAQVVGTISMDSCAIDLSEIEKVKEGDMATLIGQDGTEIIKAEQWAGLSGTVVWEILTSIAARLERVVI